jgi:hypothetical protein
VLLSLLIQLRAEGHRTLIFSQSRVMLDLIQVTASAAHAAARFVLNLWQIVLADPSAAALALCLHDDASAHNMRSFKSVRIDGSISSSGERQMRIAQFNTDTSIDVFLLTTQVPPSVFSDRQRVTICSVAAWESRSTVPTE